MRLIDADALIEAIEDQCFEWMHYETVMYFINAQQPVEPVRGEWITRYKYSDIRYCSNCGNEAYWDTDYGQQLFDFCQCCGADMRKKVEE